MNTNNELGILIDLEAPEIYNKLFEKIQIIQTDDLVKYLEHFEKLIQEILQFLSKFDQEVLDLYLENEKEDEIDQLMAQSLQLAFADD